MVSFTCGECGQTLKKNQVQHHYESECPSCSVVSCLDCGRDFYGDDYEGHTSCVSEAQKYQGKLYKSPVGGTPKGERKQQEWIEQVRKTSSANPRVNDYLMQLASFGNIPRKKSKFKNFVKNSLKLADLQVIDELWESFTGEVKANDCKLESDKSEQEPNTEHCILGGDRTSQFRKRKPASSSEQPRKKQREDHVQAGKEDKNQEDTQGRKFQWSKHLVGELARAPEQQLPVKTLRRKVLAEYTAHCCQIRRKVEDETARTKFNKKLNKVKSITVERKTATLTK